MEQAKRAALKAAGFRVGDAEDFLELSDAERRLVELRLNMSRYPSRLSPVGLYPNGVPQHSEGLAGTAYPSKARTDTPTVPQRGSTGPPTRNRAPTPGERSRGFVARDTPDCGCATPSGVDHDGRGDHPRGVGGSRQPSLRCGTPSGYVPERVIKTGTGDAAIAGSNLRTPGLLDEESPAVPRGPPAARTDARLPGRHGRGARVAGELPDLIERHHERMASLDHWTNCSNNSRPRAKRRG